MSAPGEWWSRGRENRRHGGRGLRSSGLKEDLLLWKTKENSTSFSPEYFTKIPNYVYWQVVVNEEWAIQTFDRYAWGWYTISESIGKKSGGEIFDRESDDPKSKSKKYAKQVEPSWALIWMPGHLPSWGRRVTQLYRCQSFQVQHRTALQCDRKTLHNSCNTFFKACKNLRPSQCTKTLVGWLPPRNGLLASS